MGVMLIADQRALVNILDGKGVRVLLMLGIQIMIFKLILLKPCNIEWVVYVVSWKIHKTINKKGIIQ